MRGDADGWRVAGSGDQLRRGAPDTLRAMLERRLAVLDREDQTLLECASVIGAQFSSALLAALARQDVEEVEDRCVGLVRRGLLGEAGVAVWPDGVRSGQHRFVHALYPEVLYQRVPPVRRGRLHLAAARRLEQAWGAQAGEKAAELAHHFEAGGDPAAAVRHLRTAAESALGRSAHREAAAHLRRGLALLQGVPDSPDRRRTEFCLHAMLAPTALALEGFASPEAEASFARARDLGGELNTTELSPLLFGQAMMHELRGEYTRTEAVLQERLALPRPPDDGALVDSEPLMACSMFHQGRFAEALAHAENGARLYDPDRHLALMAAYGENAGVACLGWAGLALWFLGFPDRAVERMAAAVSLGEAPGHLYSLSAARAHGAHLHQLRRDLAATREWAEAARRTAEAQGYLYNVGFAQVLQGWVDARQGESETGLALMTDGLSRLQAICARLDQPYLLALLAEAQIEARLWAPAGRTLEEALALVRRSRTFFYEAELLRLKASLLRSTDGTRAERRRRLRQALAVARKQGAKSLELRIAVDLGALLLEQGAASEARRLLRPLHRAFREGFDTPDLAHARSLLETMGAG